VSTDDMDARAREIAAVLTPAARDLAIEGTIEWRENSRAFARLESLGLVERWRWSNRRRPHKARITAFGRAVHSVLTQPGKDPAP
jgi:DNA-binding MarR family transcriptional regulator